MKDIFDDPTRSFLDVIIEKGFLSKYRIGFTDIDFREKIQVVIEDKTVNLTEKMYFCYISREGTQPFQKLITKKNPSEFEWTVIEIIDRRLNELKGQIFFAVSIWNLENHDEIAIIRYIRLYKQKFTHLTLTMTFEMISKKKFALNIIAQIETDSADFIGITDAKRIKREYEKSIFSILPNEYTLDANNFDENEIIIHSQSNFALGIKAGLSKGKLEIKNEKKNLILNFFHIIKSFKQSHLPTIFFLFDLEPTMVRNSYIGVQMDKEDWVTALAFLISRLTPPEFEESMIYEKYERINQKTIPVLLFKENQRLINQFPILYLFNYKDFNCIANFPDMKTYKLPRDSNPCLKLQNVIRSIEKHLLETHGINVKYDVVFLIPNNPILGLKCVSLIHYMKGYPIICRKNEEIGRFDPQKIRFKLAFVIGEAISHPFIKILKKKRFNIIPIGRNDINKELTIQFFVDSLIDELAKIILKWNINTLQGVTTNNPIYVLVLKELVKLGFIQKFEKIMSKIKNKTISLSDLNSLYLLFRNLNDISLFIPFLIEKVNSKFYQGRKVAGYPLKQTTITIVEKSSSIGNLINAAYFSRAYYAYLIDLDIRVRRKQRLVSALAAIKSDVINKKKITSNSKNLKDFWKAAKIVLLGSDIEFVEHYFKELPLFQYALRHNLNLKTIGSDLPENYQKQDTTKFLSVFKGFICIFSPRNALIELQIAKYFKYKFCTGRMGIKNSIITNARVLNNLIPVFKRKTTPRFMMINAVPHKIPSKLIGRVEEYIRNLGDVDYIITEYSFSKSLVLEKIKKTDFIIIWAHGNQQIINFKGWKLTYKEIREKIDNRTLILLNSCETGSGFDSKPSIIKTLLKNQNCIIITPITPIYVNDSLFFFEKFIRTLTNNLPLSVILRKIKKDSQSGHPLCAFYSFHGDPLLTFFHFSD